MLVEPTVIGVREIARRITLGQTVAIPTECTYESVAIMNRVPVTQSGVQQPHVYVTENSLPDFFEANHTLFPKRQYAYRKDGQVKAMAVFNEGYEVTKRLARKVWPGPVIIAIALDLDGDDTIEKDVEKDVYIQLRSPCHPLTVKCVQQYHRDRNTNSSDLFIVGRPIAKWTNASSPSYFTDASSCLERGTFSAILNGESPQELFYVPTCERGEPPSRICVNMAKRQVQVSCGTHLRLLQQTLRQGATPSQGSSNITVQDQILQAVLNKWTIFQEGGACSVEAE